MFAEPALCESQLLRSALEVVPVGLYMIDRDHKIVLWSEGAERITGYLRQEVIGRCCREDLLDHCDDKGERVCKTACPLACALQNGRANERVLHLKHKDGHRVPVKVYAAGLRDARGHIAGAMQTFHEQAMAVKPAALATGVAQFPARIVGGIPNRMLTLALLRDILVVARSLNAGCGVACLQIANYERFKTMHTLAAANQMMDTIAGSVTQILRQTDHVGRWSEGQFLVILPGCHASALEMVATRLAHVSHRSRIRWWGDEIAVSVWVGGVMARPDEEADALAARAVAVSDSCARRTEDGNIVLIEN